VGGESGEELMATQWRDERIGGQRLILDDCREVAVPTGVLVTDPPYPNNAGHFCDAVEAARDVLSAWHGTAALVFWSELEFPPVPLPLVAVHIWHRTNVNGRPYEPVFHFAASGEKRRSEVKDYWCIKQGIGPAAREYDGHPTQKPLAVMQWLIGKEKGLVVDPFMGVGSTLVAAEKDGRPGFGVEVNPEFFEVACRRVEQAAAQPRLFAPDAQERAEQYTLEDALRN
jgi:hypothetical protein